MSDDHDPPTHDGPRGLSGLQKGTIVISFLSVLGGAVANWTDVFNSTSSAQVGVAPPPIPGGGAGSDAASGAPIIDASPMANGASLSEGVGVHTLVPPDEVQETCADKFEGALLEGKPAGNGVLTSCDGTKIVGSFLDGLPHGNASATYSDGRKYVGEWVAGLFSGNGKFELNGGAIYQGNFDNGHASGQGQYTYPDGSVYEGNFRDDKQDGRGNLKLKTGESYEGEFHENVYHGIGKLVTATSTYEGSFVNGKREGQGVLVLSNNGRRFEGLFSDDGASGIGRVFLSQGNVFEGRWQNGQYHGCGRLSYPNGDVFVGSFDDGQRTGEGIVYSKRGSQIQSGEWRGDSLFKKRSLPRKKFPFKDINPSC